MRQKCYINQTFHYHNFFFTLRMILSIALFICSKTWQITRVLTSVCKRKGYRHATLCLLLHNHTDLQHLRALLEQKQQPERWGHAGLAACTLILAPTCQEFPSRVTHLHNDTHPSMVGDGNQILLVPDWKKSYRFCIVLEVEDNVNSVMRFTINQDWDVMLHFCLVLIVS